MLRAAGRARDAAARWFLPERTHTIVLTGAPARAQGPTGPPGNLGVRKLPLLTTNWRMAPVPATDAFDRVLEEMARPNAGAKTTDK